VYLEELILQDCEHIGDMYFKQYQQAIDGIQQIIDELYTHIKMDDKQYEEYVYKFVDIVEEVRGTNRIEFINNTLNTVNREHNARYIDLIFNFLLKKLASIGVDRNRVSIEIQKANYRFTKNLKRFHDMKIQEVEQELIGVVMFAQECLLAYGRKRVDGFYDEEQQIEVDDYEESNQYIKMTDFYEVVDWIESQGYKLVRVAGSHHIYKKGSHSVPVPLHKGKNFNKFLAFQIQKEVYSKIAC
jgi:predicted RNA binding protein YcfA (HicA-like mRNA interferase family)